MKSFLPILIFLVSPVFLYSQDLTPPAVMHNFSHVTSYEDLSSYLQLLDKQSNLLKVEIIGQSVKGRNLYAMKFSSSRFGKDKSKISVLIFAQQHGNEQSGKEGSLLLANELLKPENLYLLDRIDFLLIPQVNPDGSEANARRNANEADLNRNHVILTEPETRAVHRIFDQYLFEVSMDVHEYSPYGEDWKNYGYRKNSALTLGTNTNLNVSREIYSLSQEGYFPFFLKYLNEKKFSSFLYCPGGPPGINYIRQSTFDINDGRQSLGIQNTFSFIQEGMNGADDQVENLEHRAEVQMTGMLALLEYAYVNKERIKSMVAEERAKLISGEANQMVSIQSVHAGNGKKLDLPLYSYYSGKDTLATVEDYRPEVKSLYDVKKPEGYLIPREMTELSDWAGRQSLKIAKLKNPGDYKIEQYFIHAVDSIDFEGDIIVDPKVVTKEFQGAISSSDYIYIPTAQLKGNLVVLALEPRSMLGLVTYKNYAHLLEIQEGYPILRVNKK